MTFRRAIVVSTLSLLPLLSTVPHQGYAADLSRCGNGIVDVGEQCDPGSRDASPDCSSTCQRTQWFEASGLPFGAPMTTTDGSSGIAEIFSPGLTCKPESVRSGARLLEPVRVKYRIHLCRTAAGVDAFTPEQVRASMARTAADYADSGIILEEESLVRFSDRDCIVSMDDSSWSDALVDATPPGVLAISFVTGISSGTSQFAVGGYCYFFGPICVNAGVYETLVTHEIGHFFGLAHTFECQYGSETTANCASAGDFLCDTPPDRGPSGVSGIASCSNGSTLSGSCTGICGNKVCSDGSRPDSLDWMSYYHCTPGHFTDEQRDFMRCTLDHEMKPYNAGIVTVTSTTTTTTTQPKPTTTTLAPPPPPPPTTTTTTLPPPPPVTTTTTLPRPTTTTLPPPVTTTTMDGTTTTTMAVEQNCGDVNDDGALTAADALNVLRAGVGSFACGLWQCDFDGSGAVTASDGLRVLRAAVGLHPAARCPARA